MCGVPWYCDVSNTGRQNSVYRRQKRKFRRLVEVPKRCNVLLLWCRPANYTTSSSVQFSSVRGLNQKEYSAGSTTPPPHSCGTRVFVTGCRTAWNVWCYWNKQISPKMSSKQINMGKFADLWVVISCKLAHVDWSFRGKCYLLRHDSYSCYTYRTSALNILRHMPEKEDVCKHLGGHIGPGRTVCVFLSFVRCRTSHGAKFSCTDIYARFVNISSSEN
jgi:hypothetical protein